MRLFKFLVISNELMKKSKIVKPVVRVRLDHRRDGILKASKLISTKNQFYFYCQDLHKVQVKLLNQYNILGSKKGSVLMSLDYSNELTEFRNNNKAYVIIDHYYVNEAMKAIAPVDYKNKDNFQVFSLKICNSCVELSEPCRNKKVSINIDSDKKYIREKHGALQTIKQELSMK